MSSETPDKTDGSEQTKLATRKGEPGSPPRLHTQKKARGGAGAGLGTVEGTAGQPGRGRRAGRRARAGRRVPQVKGRAWGGLRAAATGHSPEPRGRLGWRRTDSRRGRPADIWTRGKGCRQPARGGEGTVEVLCGTGPGAVADENNRKRPNCRKRRQRGGAKAAGRGAERVRGSGPGPRLRTRDFQEKRRGFRTAHTQSHPPTPSGPAVRARARWCGKECASEGVPGAGGGWAVG